MARPRLRSCLLPLLALACGGTAKPAAPAAPPSIVVLDAGAEPRQVVRLQLTAGTTERLEVTLKLRRTMQFTGTTLQTGKQLIDLPSITYVVRSEVTEVTADGTAVISAMLDDVTVLDDDVDPALRRQVDASVRACKGARMSWRVAPSGRLSDVAFERPGASRETQARLDSLAEALHGGVTFPDAPIGAGARWQTTEPHQAGGVRWQRAATYRLQELSPTTATVEAESRAVAGAQVLDVEPDASVRLTSATSSGSAEWSAPLQGLAATGTLRATSEASLSIVRGRARVTAVMHTEALASMRAIR